GDVDQATKLARRASRMARTEGILEREYFANVTLARVRRYSFHPFLSALIISALRQVVAPRWRGLVEWEAFFSGLEPQLDEIVAGAPVGRALRALPAILSAGQAGDRAPFDRAVAEAREALGGWMLGLRDLELLLDCLDPRRIPGLGAAWCSGAVARPPFRLRATEDAAWTLVVPGRGARRIHDAGVRLLDGDYTVLDPSLWNKRRRVSQLVTTVALAGDRGIADEEVFEQIWGFPFVPIKHQAVLRQVVFRARQTLKGAAELDRVDGRLRIVPERVFAVVEPAAGPDLRERVLMALAERDASAEETAQRLKVSKRAVQMVLRELVDEGACESMKEGRAVRYGVEDTTFQAPTLDRLTADQLPGVD
ncbi:MAG: winged helix-turn-helix domain-containing protein, partial [Myxococcota bacterium]